MKLPFLSLLMIEAPRFESDAYLDDPKIEFESPAARETAKQMNRMEKEKAWNTTMNVTNQNCIRLLGIGLAVVAAVAVWGFKTVAAAATTAIQHMPIP